MCIYPTQTVNVFRFHCQLLSVSVCEWAILFHVYHGGMMYVHLCDVSNSVCVVTASVSSQCGLPSINNTPQKSFLWMGSIDPGCAWVTPCGVESAQKMVHLFTSWQSEADQPWEALRNINSVFAPKLLLNWNIDFKSCFNDFLLDLRK